jgi:HSP20 family protein
MSLPTRWRDSFDELFSFRRDFDEMFDRLLSGRGASPGRMSHAGFFPLVDSWVDRDDKKYNLRVAIPGADPKNIDVTIEGNHIRISGETRWSDERKNADYWVREFSAGRFERVVALPEGVDPDKIKAEYKDGLLEITAPFDGGKMPRRIEVKGKSSDVDVKTTRGESRRSETSEQDRSMGSSREQ